ncbi:MAG: response regulator [Planctomycetota bacterium]|nr:MAG: response regulator [Planctomycetota bacterium]
MELRRILIADDEADVRNTLRRILERAGYEVIETEDGRQALRALELRAPDLLVIDLAMPGMDGIQVLRELRLRRIQVPVIAYSGAPASDVTLDSARLLGAVAVLGKPFEPAQLLGAIAGALDHEHA